MWSVTRWLQALWRAAFGAADKLVVLETDLAPLRRLAEYYTEGDAACVTLTSRVLQEGQRNKDGHLVWRDIGFDMNLASGHWPVPASAGQFDFAALLRQARAALAPCDLDYLAKMYLRPQTWRVHAAEFSVHISRHDDDQRRLLQGTLSFEIVDALRDLQSEIAVWTLAMHVLAHVLCSRGVKALSVGALLVCIETAYIDRKDELYAAAFVDVGIRLCPETIAEPVLTFPQPRTEIQQVWWDEVQVERVPNSVRQK